MVQDPENQGSPGDWEAVLCSYSQGFLGRKEAMEILGLDYGTLLVRLSELGLPLPRLDEGEVRAMVDRIVAILPRKPET